MVKKKITEREKKNLLLELKLKSMYRVFENAKDLNWLYEDFKKKLIYLDQYFATEFINLSFLLRENNSSISFKENYEKINNRIKELYSFLPKEVVGTVFSDYSFHMRVNNDTSFLENYLGSKYIYDNGKLKNIIQIKNELDEILKQEINFNYLSEIISNEIAKDYLEVIECGKLSTTDYLFLKKLGEGSSAKTYLVKHNIMDKLFAVKVFNYEYNLDEFNVKLGNLGENFENELELIKELDKKELGSKESKILSFINNNLTENIIQIYNVGKWINNLNLFSIVMEYVDGKTLKELIEENRQTDYEKILNISSQIYSGIKSLNRLGVIHRDLTLKNIKVNSKNIVKIMDFGIATSEENPLAKDNSNNGPSEGLPASDLFSLGLITYQFARGQTVYENKYLREEYKQRNFKRISAPLQSIISSCLDDNIAAVETEYEKANPDFKYLNMSRNELIQRIKELENGNRK